MCALFPFQQERYKESLQKIKRAPKCNGANEDLHNTRSLFFFLIITAGNIFDLGVALCMSFLTSVTVLFTYICELEILSGCMPSDVGVLEVSKSSPYSSKLANHV